MRMETSLANLRQNLASDVWNVNKLCTTALFNFKNLLGLTSCMGSRRVAISLR